MPEIDETQLAAFKNVDAFVRRGLANPKTRPLILNVQKELNPDTVIPEIDGNKPINDKIDALADRFEKFTTDLSTKAEEREKEAALAQLRARWSEGQTLARKKGYADEGLKKLESFMEEKGIASHEVAIPYFEKLNPPPVQAVSSGSRWDFFGQQPSDGPDLKMLYEGHDDQWLNQTVADTLNRVRNAV
jgi:hypothetical protein